MNSEVILYILVGFLLLVVLLVVPLLYQLWRTAEQFTVTLRTLNEKLPTILRNLEDITNNMSEATQNVNERVRELSLALQRVHAFVSSVQSVEQVVRSRVRFPLVRLIQNAMPLFKGAQAFCRAWNIDSKNQG